MTTPCLASKPEDSLEDIQDIEVANETQQTSSPRQIHSVSWVLTVVAALSSLLLYAFDNTIVANIIPSILNDLGSAEKLPWLSVGFLMAGLCVAMPFGRLYGMFDTKKLYCVSILLFLAGSALCGRAPNMIVMIIGRIFAGVGGNGMYFGVVTLLSVNTTDQERPTYLALIGLVYGIGTVVGPIIGGAFANSAATWRWGFYLNLVVGGVFAPVYLWLLPSHKPEDSTDFSQKIKSFDYLGTILQSGSLAAITMAINFGGTLYPWSSSRVIVLFVVAGVLAIAFIAQQILTVLTTIRNRIFPIHLLRKKEPALLGILMAANNGGAFVLIYYIPLLFQFTRGSNALRSSIQLLPLIVLITFTIMLNGAVLSKTGVYKPWYLVGSTLMIIGGVLIARIDLSTTTARIYGLQIMLGVGIGAYLQSGYAVVQAVLPSSDLAYAVSFMLSAQLFGLVFSLSISGAVFVNRTIRALHIILPDIPREQLQRAITGISGEFFSGLSQNLQMECLVVIMNSLQKVYILVYVAGAVSFVAALLLSNKKLSLVPPTSN